MNIQLTLLFVCLFFSGFAQQDSIPEPPVFGSVEEEVVVEQEVVCFCGWEAEFPGGNRYLQDYVQYHFQPPSVITYYAEPRKKVYLEFVVNKTGDISDIMVLRGYSAEIDAELIRVIQQMPRWTPARQGCCTEIWDCSCCTLYKTNVRLPIIVELK